MNSAIARSFTRTDFRCGNSCNQCSDLNEVEEDCTTTEFIFSSLVCLESLSLATTILSSMSGVSHIVAPFCDLSQSQYLDSDFVFLVSLFEFSVRREQLMRTVLLQYSFSSVALLPRSMGCMLEIDKSFHRINGYQRVEWVACESKIVFVCRVHVEILFTALT